MAALSELADRSGLRDATSFIRAVLGSNIGDTACAQCSRHPAADEARKRFKCETTCGEDIALAKARQLPSGGT